MNCEDALKKLFDVVDQEVTQADKKEIVEHLEHCRHCMSRYDFEKMFKTFVAEKACIDCDSEKLKNKILEKLDQSRSSSR